MKDTKKSSEVEKTADSNKFSLKKEIISWIEAIVSAVILVALIITFVGRPILVDGHSMEKTLMDKDRIITTPLYSKLHHNDIVVIRRKNDLPLIKRVIALEGEIVDIDYDIGKVMIDGKEVDEPFINEPMEIPVFRTIDLPAKVPDGHVFVMGDNRNRSDDSRDPQIGMIDKRNIFGKAIFRLWPFNKLGKIDEKNYSY